jgi:NADH-quinone oxidoreductase subunit F
MKEGYALRGFLPGGASTAFLTGEHLDAAMDFANMEKTGSRLGTGTLVVLDDRTCPVAMMLSLMEFFARESCGWCTPCREGLPWVARCLQALEAGRGEPVDLEILDHHAAMLARATRFAPWRPERLNRSRGR